MAVDLIVTLPADGEGGIGFLEVNILGISIPRQAGGEVIGGIEQPCIAGFSRKQHQGTNTDEASIMFSGAGTDVINLVREMEVLSVEASFPRSAFDRSAAQRFLLSV